MNSLDFLAAVVPSAGRYCTFFKDGGIPKNVFSVGLESFYEIAQELNERKVDSWFALAGFGAQDSRKAENAVAMRSFFMDLDCGLDAKTGKPRAFQSKRAAIAALDTFMSVSGLDALGKPWLVDSGGGVHAYWPLDEDIPIASWKPVAEAFKKAAHRHSFPIDTTVTADVARVLRLPDTNNHKYPSPRPVVLKQQGDIFTITAFRTLALSWGADLTPRQQQSTLSLPGVMPGDSTPSLALTALKENSVTSFKRIMMRTASGTGCGQITHYIDNATQDGLEPVWRMILSWTRYCMDGEKAAIKISSMHPYDVDRMYQKLNEVQGPYRCVTADTVNPGICTECPNYNKLSTPLDLGREVLESREEKQVYTESEPTKPVDRPSAPNPYFYGANGGVFVRVAGPGPNDPKTDVLITSYDLWMTRMFRDETTYKAEFVAVKGTKTVTFAVPTSALSSIVKTSEVLASNNILATGGVRMDAHLAGYVRACTAEVSAKEETVNIPPTFGWQKDRSFALGDMVYSPTGDDYGYKSDRLHNLIMATETRGSLSEWQDVMVMLRRKKLWGHLSFALSGLGSILMDFMPANSRACVLHVAGSASSTGKTLALALNSSLWGSHERFKVKADTSITTMMQRAGLWGSLPLNVDEVTQIQRDSKGEFMPKITFSYSEGSHKIKGSAQGNNEISHELLWSGKLHMTSNTPAFEALLGARQFSSNGEARRMLEWVMRDDEVITWTPEEREILSKLEWNYGMAGKMFAQWCVRNQDTVRSFCGQIREDWRHYASATDDERFWTSSIAADLTAMLLCGEKYANIFNMPTQPVKDFWLQRVREQRQAINANRFNALDLFNVYVRENYHNFIKVSGDKITGALLINGTLRPDAPRGAIRGRVEHEVMPGMKDMYIEEKMLKEYCGAIGRSYKLFVEELSSNHDFIIRPTRKNLLAGTGGPVMSVACLKISHPIDSKYAKAEETAEPAIGQVPLA